MTSFADMAQIPPVYLQALRILYDYGSCDFMA